MGLGSRAFGEAREPGASNLGFPDAVEERGCWGEVYVQVGAPGGVGVGGEVKSLFERQENRRKVSKMERPSVPNGVDGRAFGVFERCVGVRVPGRESSLGEDSRACWGPKDREKAMVELQPGWGEGCSGRGALTRSPGSSGGRGPAGARQLNVRVPFPHPPRASVRMPWGGWGRFFLWRAELPGDCSARSRLRAYLAAVGPHFPEALGPSWGVAGR